VATSANSGRPVGWPSRLTKARLHFVTGKGGTGKSTIAASLALALAAGGRKVLLVEVEGRQGIAQLFDVPPLPYQEVKIATADGGGQVNALAIDTEAAFLEYLDMFYNLGLAGRAMRRIGAVEFATTIAPGLRDVLLTGKIREIVTRAEKGKQPVYDAIVAHDLVMGMTWGGTSEGPPTPSGWPSYYAEEWAGEQGVFMSQLTSMVAEGVFQRYPTFRLAVLDIGFNWVPSLMWRLNKEWKGLHRTIPWVNEPPSQIFRDHIRFTTAPLDAAPPSESARFLRWLGEEMVMFASDYPHAYPGDYRRFLDALPESARPKIMADNARAFYRL